MQGGCELGGREGFTAGVELDELFSLVGRDGLPKLPSPPPFPPNSHLFSTLNHLPSTGRTCEEDHLWSMGSGVGGDVVVEKHIPSGVISFLPMMLVKGPQHPSKGRASKADLPVQEPSHVPLCFHFLSSIRGCFVSIRRVRAQELPNPASS